MAVSRARRVSASRCRLTVARHRDEHATRCRPTNGPPHPLQSARADSTGTSGLGRGDMFGLEAQGPGERLLLVELSLRLLQLG